jgi:prepilin-type N-terminal cleavage/methylation domain-containing protein
MSSCPQSILFQRSNSELDVLIHHRHRRGLSLVESLVVLGIIAILMALLFPAVQAARNRARDTVCKNNVYQTNLALVQYMEVMKRIPPPSEPGKVGGWMTAILPFLERSDLDEVITEGIPLQQAPEVALAAPPIYRCLIRDDFEKTPPKEIRLAHFAMIPSRDRKAASIVDVPLKFEAPWLSSPELSFAQLPKMGGPHNGGYFIAHGVSQGVDLWDPTP